ncbi:hypothetical protein [Ilyomonas limi]|uniref:hypothetical protein n=1 Tax=Ilyomonas limi TaxID=2575867 RepID=UPI0014853595|nr:hypothetical protein [Ilyomonas limi]
MSKKYTQLQKGVAIIAIAANGPDSAVSYVMESILLAIRQAKKQFVSAFLILFPLNN